MIALLLLLFTYALIAGRRWRALPIGRPMGALAGAVGMVLTGVLAPAEAFRAVELNTIGLLLGMMLLARQLDADGVMRWAERALLASAKTPWGALVRLSVLAGALSSILVNDTVCVLATPVVVSFCKRHRLPLPPFLLALATASNIGSAATLVGNPQNMLIAHMSGMSFAAFLARSAPAVLAAGAVHLLVCRVYFGRHLPAVLVAAPAPEEAPHGRTRRGSSIVLLGVAVAMLAGADFAWAALSGATLLILFRRKDPSHFLAELDWSLLLFFASLFVVVTGAFESPLVVDALDAIAAHADPSTLRGQVLLCVGVVLGSNLVSNVPLVMLLGPQLGGHGDLGWVELAFVSTLAGNLTLVGSVANLIVAEAAREEHEIGFWEYLRFGAATTVATIGVGVPLLVVTDGWFGA